MGDCFCGVGLKFSIVVCLRPEAREGELRVIVSLFPILIVCVFVFLVKRFGEIKITSLEGYYFG